MDLPEGIPLEIVPDAVVFGKKADRLFRKN
jgi:hypothetical protein